MIGGNFIALDVQNWIGIIIYYYLPIIVDKQTFIEMRELNMNFKRLIENDNFIIIPDTNVLLNVYRYSPEFSEFALECLRNVSDCIYLPATVKMEYDKHYRGEFSKMVKRIEEATQETEKQIQNAKDKILSSCDRLIISPILFTDVLISRSACSSGV